MLAPAMASGRRAVGVIAMDAVRVPSMSFDTPGMFRGYAGRDGGRFVEMSRD